jgi:hypothetical protein
MLSLTTLLIILAVTIIAGLAFYAGRLLQLVAAQKKAQQAAELAKNQGLLVSDNKALESVLLITRAMREEQCDFSEGCWRISVLLSSLKTIDATTLPFKNIFAFYEGIKDLAILDERKKLPKKQRMQQDLKRMKLESSLNLGITEELVELEQYVREKIAENKQ